MGRGSKKSADSKVMVKKNEKSNWFRSNWSEMWSKCACQMEVKKKLYYNSEIVEKKIKLK